MELYTQSITILCSYTSRFRVHVHARTRCSQAQRIKRGVGRLSLSEIFSKTKDAFLGVSVIVKLFNFILYHSNILGYIFFLNLKHCFKSQRHSSVEFSSVIV